MKYDELDFFEFFESEPSYLFEKEAGICSYSYEKDDFKIYVLLSCYENYVEVDISYKRSTVYSGEIRNIEVWYRCTQSSNRQKLDISKKVAKYRNYFWWKVRIEII